jgi:uncharacterized membrane protein (UPF0182 family)
VQPPRRGFLVMALAIGVIIVFGGALLRLATGLYTEHLWFQEVGYTRVFWTRNLAAAGVRAIAAVVAGAIIFLNLALVMRRLGPVRLRHRYGNLEIAEQVPRRHVMLSAFVIAALGGWWMAALQFGDGVPLKLWAWLHHAQWGSVDPLFHRDLSFYVFTLPVLLLAIDHILMTIFWSAVLVTVGYSLVGAVRMEQNRAELDPAARNHFAFLLAALLCTLALRLLVARYAVAINGTGVHGGIGYTDVHVRILGLSVLACLAVIAAASLVYGVRRELIAPPIAGIAALIIGAILFGGILPASIQKFLVQPNQLEREAQYIQWNMDYTRQAFGVADLQRKHVAFTTATPSTWSAAAPTLNRLVLWDVDQLEDAFNQVQTFQGYYTFTDVDFDRYPLNGVTEQVGIGVREFQKEGLPNDSRNWFALHRRPEFTRGVGIASAQLNSAVGGAPDYLVGEVAPIRVAPSASQMALTDPSIFFGELSNEYIVLAKDSTGKPAPAGVQINSLFRKVAFASALHDHNLLFTGDLDAQSRLLFHRLARERVEEIAPFLTWDQDALPIVANGHVVWVLDGYTISNTFPLAAHRALGRTTLNYIRPSAKATVDAVTGAVRLYATDAGDPILRTYAAMFPGLVRARAEMPAWLAAHLRYPATMLAIQASILEQYHVEQLNAFFAGQDAWAVPDQGAARGTPRPNEPLTMLLQMEGKEEPQYVSLLPFTARQRQNLTAMIVAQNDSADYGKLTLVDVTGDEQIKGPAQIQSLIEQDPEISQQLSLWRQHGTDVELGQLRIIPTSSSVLYIEPLFIAAQDKAIPQLFRVLASDGATVVMAESIDRAVQELAARNGGTVTGLIPSEANGLNAGANGTAASMAANVTRDNNPANGATANGAGGANGAGSATANGANAPSATGANIGATGQRPNAQWSAEALRLYDQAEAQLRAGDFAAFGATWQKLHVVLQNAARDSRKP